MFRSLLEIIGLVVLKKAQRLNGVTMRKLLTMMK